MKVFQPALRDWGWSFVGRDDADGLFGWEELLVDIESTIRSGSYSKNQDAKN